MRSVRGAHVAVADDLPGEVDRVYRRIRILARQIADIRYQILLTAGGGVHLRVTQALATVQITVARTIEIEQSRFISRPQWPAARTACPAHRGMATLVRIAANRYHNRFSQVLQPCGKRRCGKVLQQVGCSPILACEIGG